MRIKLVQNLIDKIRNKPNFIKLLVYKTEAIKNKENFKTLILGSSHLANGYIAQENEFNFAMPSQDLYYAYQLYKKFNNSNIENIIIAISVFTPGLSIVKTQCADFCVAYKTLLHIDYQYEEEAKIRKLFELEEKTKKEILSYQKKLELPKNYRGNLLWFPHQKFNTQEAHKRALKHLKNNRRKNSQMNFCADILKEAKTNNQKVYFILPPTTKTYREVLPQTNILFQSLFDITAQFDNAKILNFFEADFFNEKTDFSNEDHLNEKGAYILADLIREEICD